MTFCRSPLLLKYKSLIPRLMRRDYHVVNICQPKTLLKNTSVSCTGVPHISVVNQLHVLGIETSCDDTGAAVVNESGTVIGEALNSQTRIHVELGGINPPVAQTLHRQNIDGVIQEALRNAGIKLNDVDCIATTTCPGLLPSLRVGLEYTRGLLKQCHKPFIPIHHMEAHALTARMLQRIDFPFLVFLMSGGHCLLAVVQSVDRFLLLGENVDDAPGDAFDKVARELRLKGIPECIDMSGGQSIETVAKEGNPHAFDLHTVMTRTRSCDFSFSGIKSQTIRNIKREYKRQDLSRLHILPNVSDLCASFQYYVLHHMARRLERALIYCEMKGLLPNHKTVVISGGVACNSFIFNGLTKVCHLYNGDIIRPPTQLCTDNGVMVAWNGVEKFKAGLDIYPNADDVIVQRRSPLGQNLSDDILAQEIKTTNIKLL